MKAVFEFDTFELVYEVSAGYLGNTWAKLASTATLPDVPVRWNHLVCTDYTLANMRSADDRLRYLSYTLGFGHILNPITSELLNRLHRKFVNTHSVGPRSLELYELNVLIHYIERHMQGAGPTISVDLNHSAYQVVSLPLDAKPEYMQDGGLYLLYAQIGRCWDELVRANDLVCSPSDYLDQQVFNASCMLCFYNQQPLETELEYKAMRLDLDVPGTPQRGAYRIGTLIDTPEEFNAKTNIQQVRQVRILK